MALLKVLLLLLGLCESDKLETLDILETLPTGPREAAALCVSMNSHVSLHKRIIGGQNCDDKERLYHVRLERVNGTHTSWCGGSLIHPRWILTAAHCWRSEPGWNTTVTLGVHPRNATQEKQIIQHNPVMYFDQSHQRHDIMLLKLQRPVRNIRPARLRSCNNRPRIGAKVQLAGEGPTTTNLNNQQYIERPPHLQCVDMKISGFTFSQTHGHLVIAEAPNKDVSIGDSGGGLVLYNKIYGVIAGHDATSKVYSMIVCEYMEWIRNTTGLNKPKLS